MLDDFLSLGSFDRALVLFGLLLAILLGPGIEQMLYLLLLGRRTPTAFPADSHVPSWGSVRQTRRLSPAHLPLHQLGERAVFPAAQFRVAALFGYAAVGAQDDDGVGALDGREAVGDRYGGVVSAQEGGEGGVDERF